MPSACCDTKFGEKCLLTKNSGFSGSGCALSSAPCAPKTCDEAVVKCYETASHHTERLNLSFCRCGVYRVPKRAFEAPATSSHNNHLTAPHYSEPVWDKYFDSSNAADPDALLADKTNPADQDARNMNREVFVFVPRNAERGVVIDLGSVTKNAVDLGNAATSALDELFGTVHSHLFPKSLVFRREGETDPVVTYEAERDQASQSSPPLPPLPIPAVGVDDPVWRTPFVTPTITVVNHSKNRVFLNLRDLTTGQALCNASFENVSPQISVRGRETLKLALFTHERVWRIISNHF